MIVGMAQVEEAEITEKMITAMSRLFRYNLKSTASVMPLEREIKVVEDYIYLQKMRFGGRIRYSIDCSPETLDLLIPSFALQPIVENAIVHGICDKPEGGKICIRSWMEGRKLWISVADVYKRQEWRGEVQKDERIIQTRRSLFYCYDGCIFFKRLSRFPGPA